MPGLLALRVLRTACPPLCRSFSSAARKGTSLPSPRRPTAAIWGFGCGMWGTRGVTSSATQHLMGEAKAGERKVPISLLSGFLGSGKTTLLQEVLHNKGGLKVGVVVNDVADVNIDAKLVRERSSSGIQTKSGEGVEFVELENGCACCDASGELLACIEHLLEISAVGGYEYDRIIIEMSGVAEPRNIRAEFHEAMRESHPVFDRSELTSMITVVDSPHFFRLYSSKNGVADHEELLGKEEQKVETYDTMKWVEVERKVVDLLVEQVECADMVVLNKVDAVEDQTNVGSLHSIVEALNPNSQVFECSFGKVPMHEIFGRDKGRIVMSDDDEDIRSAVRAATEAEARASHGGGGHGHEHGHSHAEDCAAPACDHPSHGEGHGHEHGHSHSHTHTPNAAEKYGITTFVYSRRRPFHPQRLLDFVALLPVKNATRQSWLDHVPAEKWDLGNLFDGKLNTSMDEGLVTMHTVVRSKGFVWASSQWQNALYWSQAGAHFELSPLGMWWAATKLSSWPDGGDPHSSEVGNILHEFDVSGGPHGDRRQEIVFIGVGMDRVKIEALLDACLLTDEEMALAEQRTKDTLAADPVTVKVDDSAPSGRKALTDA